MKTLLDQDQKDYIKRLIEERSVPDPNSGCWLWTASTQKSGYGDFRAFGRKHFLSHRASYTVFVGDIPEGMHILHKCDNPSCCNPNHLSVGTNHENILDSMKKGRRKGVGRVRPSGLTYKPSNEKTDRRIVLTKEMLDKAKELMAGGMRPGNAAKDIGVKYHTLHQRLINEANT